MSRPDTADDDEAPVGDLDFGPEREELGDCTGMGGEGLPRAPAGGLEDAFAF